MKEEKIRVLHIVQNSLPLISGSTIRSKYIFKYQKKFADVIVLSSFLFKSKKSFEIIDKIPYFRINPKISRLLRIYNRVISIIDNNFYKYFKLNLGVILKEIHYFPLAFFTKLYIKEIIKFYDIDIIHQHTQPLFGKFSLDVAKKLNIPYVYEVRGFIEENMLVAMREKKMKSSLLRFIYNKIKRQENFILKNSDFIITLSKPMKDILVSRNINEKKIEVIPNCIEPSLYNELKDDKVLREKLKIKEKIVIGFFGKLSWYEGIEILLQAIRLIIENEISIKLIIIGSVVEDYLIYLKNIIKDLEIQENVLFLKAVPHEDLRKYYALIDMIVLPRLDNPVSRIVTPLKPLDAMGFNRLVLASDLPALRYTITDGKTGILFKPEDSSDLVAKILFYHTNKQKKTEIEINAKKYVEENFSWEKIIPQYKEYYESLMTNIEK